MSVNVGVKGGDGYPIVAPKDAKAGRRIAAVWMRDFSINIAFKKGFFQRKSIAVLFRHEAGRDWIFAASAGAQAAGIAPGQAVADARSLYPGLAAHEADPARDRRALERLADWCGRYTPWVGVDETAGSGEAGLFLDVTGCAHLRGGESGFLAHFDRHLCHFNLDSRLSVAEAPGAAWAWARFRPPGSDPILTAGTAAAALGPLPVEALRVAVATAETLRRLGLRTIADLARLPRPAVAARFGATLLRRLDQALGRAPESIAPRRPPADYAVHRDFAEPLMVPAALPAALARLLPRLCRQLERDGRGARRLVFSLYRIDGSAASAAIGTSLPARDPVHLAKLFAPRLETLDPDPGIETLRLEAPETAPFAADQARLVAPASLDPTAPRTRDVALATLIDRLVNRLGANRVGTFVPEALHLPERQARFVPALAAAANAAAWPDAPAPLPLRLFPTPEPVEVQEPAACPEDPPLAFLWRHRRHRLAHAEGPDRRLGAWWQGERAARDYWAAEDKTGRRLWLFRDLATGRWHVHGVLAPAGMAGAS